MSNTYYNCTNLTGSPVCGPSTIHMNYTYFNCYKLTGSPVVSPNTKTMNCTYWNCTNLTGAPVFGEVVNDIANAYRNCSKLEGNTYIYSVLNAVPVGVFNGKSNSRRLNVYIPSGTNTETYFSYTNSYSILNRSVTWTNNTSNGCFYNTTFNIYIYPVANVYEARAINGD